MNGSPCNSGLLRWAREEANLSVEEAALKAGIQDLKPKGEKPGLPAGERLARWEDGVEYPSFQQLEKLAWAYRRPVLTFFLKSTPRKTSRMADFRTVGDSLVKPEGNSAEFAAFIREVEALHGDIHDLCKQKGAAPLPFVGSVSAEEDDVNTVAAFMRRLINLSVKEQRRIRSKEAFFSVLRGKFEEAGIFVLQMGNLGSYHTNIPPDVFRGLAISDPIAPLIVINHTDAQAAKLFSLLHELVHICLGETGYSNLDSLSIKRQTRITHETFCNKVAGEFLVPEEELQDAWKSTVDEGIGARIANLSRAFKVSRIVIGRRLLDVGLIDEGFYWSLYKSLQAEWRETKAAQQDGDNVVPYVIRTVSRLGRKTIATVMEATREGYISLLEASNMLKVKIDQFDKLYEG